MYLKIEDVSTILTKTHHQRFQNNITVYSVLTCNYQYVATADYTELTNTEQAIVPEQTSLTTDFQEHFHFISSKHTFLPTERVNWICAVKIFVELI